MRIRFYILKKYVSRALPTVLPAYLPRRLKDKRACAQERLVGWMRMDVHICMAHARGFERWGSTYIQGKNKMLMFLGDQFLLLPLRHPPPRNLGGGAPAIIIPPPMNMGPTGDIIGAPNGIGYGIGYGIELLSIGNGRGKGRGGEKRG